MAIGWVSLLKSVPWSDVISTAPVVVEGARKLWNAASRQPALPREPQGEPHAQRVSEAQAIQALEGRIGALEAALSQLHSQMVASSELIKVLADQNAQLIGRIEAQRRFAWWLTAAATAAVVMAGSGLLWQWVQLVT